MRWRRKAAPGPEASGAGLRGGEEPVAGPAGERRPPGAAGPGPGPEQGREGSGAAAGGSRTAGPWSWGRPGRPLTAACCVPGGEEGGGGPRAVGGGAAPASAPAPA